MELKLIPDKELDSLEEKDLLGTLPYVKTIHEVIKTCETPFNIGLFAGWGGGKSSIVETLIKRIKEDNEKKKDIVTFKYDAWKYSQDPFRRTFIIQIMEEFNLKGVDKLDSLLYDNSSTETEGQTKFNTSWLFRFIFLAPIIFWLIWFFNVQTDTKLLVTAMSIVSGMVLFVLKEIFTTYKITIHKSKIIEPEKFEKIFEEIVDEITYRPPTFRQWLKQLFNKEIELKERKLLIVIDNIDRCNEAMVIDLLLTIKNFLDKKNIVFILPIDEFGVTYFLQNSNQNATEFLRKIFNSTIRIKSFSNEEMFDYSWNLVTKYELDKIGISREVVQLACQEYTTNPRKIIQFLNNFQMEIHLVKQQESLNYLNDNRVSQNFEFLAKLSIIREEWASLYQRIFDNQYLLKKIEDAIANNQYEEKEGKLFHHKTDFDLPELNEKQLNFFTRTRGIFPNGNIEPFMVNRDLLKDVPDVVNDLIGASNWAKIKELISNGEMTFDGFYDTIKKFYDRDIIKRKLFVTSGFNVFSLLSQIVLDAEYQDKLKKKFEQNSNLLEHLISDIAFSGIIRRLKPHELTASSKWLLEFKKDNLLKSVTTLLNGPKINDNDNEHNALLNAFILEFSESEKILQSVAARFSGIIHENFERTNDFSEILANPFLAKQLVQDSLINSVIEGIDAQTMLSSKNKIDFLKIMLSHEILNQNQPNTIIQKIHPHLISNNDWNYLKLNYEALNLFLDKLTDDSCATNLYQTLENRHGHYLNQIRSGQVQPECMQVYKLHEETLQRFYLAKSNYRNQICDWLQQIAFSQGNHPELTEKTSEVFCVIGNSVIRDRKVLNNLLQCYNSGPSQETKNKLIDTAIFEVVKFGDYDNGTISPFVDVVLNEFYSGTSAKDKFAERINQISKTTGYIPCIIQKFSESDNIDKKKLLISALDSIENKEVEGNLVHDLLNLSLQQNTFPETIDFIIKNFTNGRERVQAKLVEKLKSTSGAELQHLIEVVVANKAALDKVVFLTALIQLKAFLAVKQIEEIVFALRILASISHNEISDDVRKVLSPLLAELIELDEAGEELKKSVLTKFPQ